MRAVYIIFMERFLVSKEKAKDKTYSQKGFRSFIYRYADSGFRTKWTGLWIPPFKILDYHAYNVDGEWLDSNTQRRFVLEKETGTHTYWLKDGKLRAHEHVFVPEDAKSMISVLVLENKTGKPIKAKVGLECGANIRTKNENWHNREYDVKYNNIRRCIDISSPGMGVYSRIGIGMSSGARLSYSREGMKYRDHEPSGEKQRCFVPGTIKIDVSVPAGKAVPVPIIFSASDLSFKDLCENHDRSIKYWEQMIEDKDRRYIKLFRTERIETGDDMVDEAFSWSALNLINLMHKGESFAGMLAGLPWFLRFWSRDMLWSVLGLVDIGEFEAAHDCLMHLSTKMDNGRIPTVVGLDGKCEYYSEDVNPLFIVALDHYTKVSGDASLSKRLSKVVSKMKDSIELDSRDLVKCSAKGSWMDSIERHGTHIETQSLWVEALKDRDRKLSGRMKNALESQMWNHLENYPKDTSTDDVMTINCTVPLMLSQMCKSRSVITLNRIDEEFKTGYGVRTRSPFQEGYGSSKYHEGASWGLTTGWTALANLVNGLSDEGLDCIKMMADEMPENEISGMAECIDADDGRSLGASKQAWSHAMYIHAIDRGMFGIDADLTRKMICIRPSIPEDMGSIGRFGKKIGIYSLSLRMERDDKKSEMHVLFDIEPKGLKGYVDLGSKVNKVVVNGKEFKGSSAEFSWKKENSIVGLR